jgi:multisubunit Na+/H+ antiporter MnhG subunit
MNKALVILFLILVAAFSKGYLASSSYAKDIKPNVKVNIDNQSNIFNLSTNGKEKTQFRTDNNKSTFMLKGVIAASSSSSITIDNKLINIDSSVTGNVKIVGTTSVGSYAMIQGIIKNANLYAQKIVVNQRNKNEIKNENTNDINNETTLTITPTPIATTTPTITPTPVGTESANLGDISQQIKTTSGLGNVITTIQKFLNYLIDVASKI